MHKAGAASWFSIRIEPMDELENSAIIDAVETGRLNEVRELIEEYLNWMLSTHPDAEKIREVLATQGVEAELADLAGHYERVWLATVDNGPLVACPSRN